MVETGLPRIKWQKRGNRGRPMMDGGRGGDGRVYECARSKSWAYSGKVEEEIGRHLPPWTC
jgi:hypothetical protein